MDLGRAYRPLLHRGESVRNKALRTQFGIDLAEARLPLVQVDELDLGLNRHGVLQRLAAMRQHQKLTALNVHLQEIDGRKRNVVEPSGCERGPADDLGVWPKEREACQRRRTR